MGNCTNQFIDVKHSAAQNLQNIFQNSQQSSPIVFFVKEWPEKNSIDLNCPNEAITRSLNLNLYPGEKIQITLKTHQRSLKENLPQSEEHSPSCVLSKNGLHCQIRRNSQFYQIDFPIEKQHQFLWRYTHGWTEYTEGDVMRMGVTKYKLCKFITNNFSELQDLQKSLNTKPSSLQEAAPRCRICLSTVDTPENPFISPCKCDGSIKFAHLRCLSAWLFSSSLNENEFLRIRTNKSICQLCKTDMTDTEQFKKMENILLSNLHDIPAPYAIFECYHFKEQKKNVKDYFVLSFKKKQDYTFGRSTKADISDKNDIRISKINTEMKFSNGTFSRYSDRLYIRDRESLHGTFLQVRQSIRLFKSNVSQQLAFHNMLVKIVYEPKMEKDEMEVLPEINAQSSTKI